MNLCLNIGLCLAIGLIRITIANNDELSPKEAQLSQNLNAHIQEDVGNNGTLRKTSQLIKVADNTTTESPGNSDSIDRQNLESNDLRQLGSNDAIHHGQSSDISNSENHSPASRSNNHMEFGQSTDRKINEKDVHLRYHPVTDTSNPANYKSFSRNDQFLVQSAISVPTEFHPDDGEAIRKDESYEVEPSNLNPTANHMRVTYPDRALVYDQNLADVSKLSRGNDVVHYGGVASSLNQENHIIDNNSRFEHTPGQKKVHQILDPHNSMNTKTNYRSRTYETVPVNLPKDGIMSSFGYVGSASGIPHQSNLRISHQYGSLGFGSDFREIPYQTDPRISYEDEISLHDSEVPEIQDPSYMEVGHKHRLLRYEPQVFQLQDPYFQRVRLSDADRILAYEPKFIEPQVSKLQHLNDLRMSHKHRAINNEQNIQGTKPEHSKNMEAPVGPVTSLFRTLNIGKNMEGVKSYLQHKIPFTKSHDYNFGISSSVEFDESKRKDQSPTENISDGQKLGGKYFPTENARMISCPDCMNDNMMSQTEIPLFDHPVNGQEAADDDRIYQCSIMVCEAAAAQTPICACNYITGKVVTFKSDCDRQKHNCRFFTKFRTILPEICPWEFQSRRFQRKFDYSDEKYYNIL